MTRLKSIKANQNKIYQNYRQLIEEAYNYRQTDSALSDLSEFKAIKLMNKLNKLGYLDRDTTCFKKISN